jgi:selenocysteine-specific elongation factor
VTVVIGTAGHIDHGKTTLLRALTGTDADRLPEEQRRGLTIDIGFAHGSPDGGPEIDYVDVPGHDRLVGNMLVGVGEIDAALLVVAADDGLRAQTWEHLALLDAMCIEHGVVAVTKADLVDEARIIEVMDAVEQAVVGTTLAGSPSVAVSGTTGEGLEELRARLAELRDRAVAGATEKTGAWLAIDRVFTVRGHGIVVTGSSRGAPIAAGQSLDVIPGGERLRVRAIQVHDVAVECSPGRGRVGLNVAGAEMVDLRRGQLLVSDAQATDVLGPVESDRMLVLLRPPADLPGRRLDDAWPPLDGTTLRLHIGTAQVGATVGRSGRDAVSLPDGTAVAMLHLDHPVATAIGERLVLRRPPPAGLLAGGVVLDPAPQRGRVRRRQTPEALARLASAVGSTASGPAEEALLELHGWLRRSHGSRLARDIAAATSHDLLESVDAYQAEHPDHAGMPLGSLRSLGMVALRRRLSIPDRDARPLVDELLSALFSSGELVREADDVHTRDHRPPQVDAHLEQARSALVSQLDVAGPPPLGRAAEQAGCTATDIRELERSGRIVMVDDDLAWSAGAFERLRGLALGLTTAGPLTPAALRDASGTSRKYVMALLEELDRRGILKRTPAGHVRGPRA